MSRNTASASLTYAWNLLALRMQAWSDFSTALRSLCKWLSMSVIWAKKNCWKCFVDSSSSSESEIMMPMPNLYACFRPKAACRKKFKSNYDIRFCLVNSQQCILATFDDASDTVGEV